MVLDNDLLTVGLAQIAPIWLNRQATLDKVVEWVIRAADKDCQLVVFGEALLPGYPFWIERTEGARFNSSVQKDIHAHYVDQAVQIDSGHLESLCLVAKERQIAIYLGCIERASERGHSLYCSLVYIDQGGVIQSIHRKLVPTYEERLSWSPGDGHGLRVHSLHRFAVGGLNCWENWMPLSRASLYAQGEDLHVAVWPGSLHNTHDITRFIAKESRSYVISVCGLLRRDDIPKNIPHYDKIIADNTSVFASGGSCVAAPDGEWVIEPCAKRETLLTATVDHQKVRAERQNFDPSGHYSRPDVTRLVVDRSRQAIAEFNDPR